MAAFLKLNGAGLVAAMIVGLALVDIGRAYAQSAKPVVLERLEPQDMNPGECGLFLWSRDDRQDLVFAAFDTPGIARVRTDGRTWSIPRRSFGGESSNGHFERQSYSNNDMTVVADLSFDAARPMSDGVVVKDGTLRITSSRGWETVIPVGGMAACMKRPNR